MWVDTLQAFESMCVLQLLGGQCPVTGVVLEEFIYLYFTFYQLLKKKNKTLDWSCGFACLWKIFMVTHIGMKFLLCLRMIPSSSPSSSLYCSVCVVICLWVQCPWRSEEGIRFPMKLCVCGGYVDVCLCRNMHMWVQEPWKLVESFGASWVGVAQAVVSNTVGENWAQVPQRSNEYS